MATKISDLTGITAGTDAMELVVNDAGTSKKITGAQVRDYTFSEIDGLTSQVTAEDANLVVIRDGSDSKKLTLQAIKNFSDGPIGSYKYFDSDFPNIPALSSWWVECNGQTISDSLSPFNGYRTRNYNGADVVLTGIAWASGVATIPAVDITALAVGDDVSGGAIASGAYISDITGTTVTLTDTAISATIDTTFTNDGRFIRGGSVSGVGKKDSFQGFNLNIDYNSSASAFGAFAIAGATNAGSITTTITAPVKVFTTDGTNGTPRVDSETRPIYTSQVVIFKIK